MKHKLYIFVIIFLICSLVLGYAIYNYYDLPTERQPYLILHHNDDTLRIAYIGDSWAALHKEHECIIAKIISDSIHRPVKVSSYGLHGKTSKEIFESLFDNQDMRSFMLKGYDFCIISAGINDTYKKMSIDYYKASMNFIIHFMLSNNIKPIILEIPDYNILLAYERQSPLRKLIRKVSISITGSQLNCKQSFRNTLSKFINEHNYKKQISILTYREWNNNYSVDLQRYYTGDGMHLNNKGYNKLDSSIVYHIMKQLH